MCGLMLFENRPVKFHCRSCLVSLVCGWVSNTGQKWFSFFLTLPNSPLPPASQSGWYQTGNNDHERGYAPAERESLGRASISSPVLELEYKKRERGQVQLKLVGSSSKPTKGNFSCCSGALCNHLFV
jgi:hypothetical protein